jgi:hypothetical protein
LRKQESTSTSERLATERADAGKQSSVPKSTCKPVWDKDRGTLEYDGQLVKRIKNLGPAKNVVAVLIAFEEAHWPQRIDDPLPEGLDPRRRLNETLRSLNKNLAGIRFFADGTGKGICWEARP